MRIIYDFECTSCGHVFEDMVKRDIKEVPCKKCGEKATRNISTPNVMHCPGMYNYDVRRKEQAQKQQRETGTTQRKPWS